MASNPANWVKFFTSAGIPSSTAATYAHVFFENRIQMDMLMDLNKEYLREMGITPMGDIIAILRNARTVHEQSARDKILSCEPKPPVATVIANTTVLPSVPPASPIPTQRTLRSEITTAASNKSNNPVVLSTVPKQTRRVLPEHEGRYKVTLPTGTTQRSKEILSRKALLYADKEDVGVFDRLSINNNPIVIEEILPKKEQVIRITGLDKPSASLLSTASPTALKLSTKSPSQTLSSSSVFTRLGGKDTEVKFSGILKTSPKRNQIGIVNKPSKSQKIILVKKIPAKAATMVADEYHSPSKMETGEKFVSFSSEDEILEIAPRRQLKSTESIRYPVSHSNIQSRLGRRSPSPNFHKTKKTINFKNSSSNMKLKASNVNRMRSDELFKSRLSIQSRLSLTNRAAAVSTLTKEMRRVSLDSRLNKSSNVFDRLGFNN